MKHKILKALRLLPPSVVPKTFRELEVYPQREERKTTLEYEKNHKILIYEEKHPCWLCGITLEESHEQGMNLETHHFAEHQLWEAFDPMKVYNDLKKWDFHGHAKDLPQDPNQLGPDHIANLVVLCSACHREDGYGIHGATFPFVVARRWLKDKNQDVLKRYKKINRKKTPKK